MSVECKNAEYKNENEKSCNVSINDRRCIKLDENYS